MPYFESLYLPTKKSLVKKNLEGIYLMDVGLYSKNLVLLSLREGSKFESP